MADLKLKRVVIKNWMKYRQAEIEFPDKGLVLVTGINAASGGKMASVGAGKTAFGEAICRALLGSKGRFTHPRSYSLDKKGDCYIRVEATHRDVPLIVETGYKSKELGGTGEALRYQYGGKGCIERSRMEETREEITSIIGVTPLLSNWTVFVRGKKIEFSELSQEDAVNLVMASLAQPPWTKFFDRSKVMVAQFKNAASNSENRHADVLLEIVAAKARVVKAEDHVAKCKAVYDGQRKVNDERIKALTEEIESKKKLITSGDAQKVAIGKRMAQIEAEKAEKQHALEIERNAIDDKLTAAGEKRDAAVEKRSSAKNALDNDLAKLDELKSTPKDCPSCGKPWDKAHGEDEIKKQDEKVTKSEKSYDARAKVVDDINEVIATLKKDRRVVSNSLDALGVKGEINGLRDECAEIESTNRARDRRMHAIELEIIELKMDVSDAEVKAAKATLEERLNQVDSLNDELKECATALSETKETMKVVNYWNKAFSPTGIPNMVLSEAIGPMNDVAKTISHRMTGGTIHVTYGTSKQLATGVSKAELIINVDNDIGSSEIQGSSNGEGGLTNFIISETLSEIGNVSGRVGFRWYDEVVPYQDPIVAKSIYAYMREVAHRLGILVFLVDHNPVAENYADHVLVVKKTREETSINWR